MTDANDHRYDPDGGPYDRSLRVGDKERDAVGEILGQAHVDGRLDNDEFQSRLERCLTAKTYTDLDGLIADLPRERAHATARHRAGLRPWPMPFLLLPLAAIAAIAVGAHAAWLAVPLVFFFVVRPLAWRAWGGGPARGYWACGPRRTTRA
jgi:Domain of unknown function (DUF1707)